MIEPPNYRKKRYDLRILYYTSNAKLSNFRKWRDCHEVAFKERLDWVCFFGGLFVNNGRLERDTSVY